ncbi:MAG: HAD family hydrolase [Planctomycetota bacterium]|jgi:phosphoglycolate phosphatase-like HAD superfamily hydrolase
MTQGDPQAELKAFEPKHEFFVGIDSDGCAFDTMEVKHKECFIPNTVKHWGLQPVSKYARAAAEFVNLYSKWRGINRFPALMMVFELLRDWGEVRKREVEIPYPKEIQDFIDSGLPLGNPALKDRVNETGDPVLKRTLDWSEGVNATVADVVHGVPPFPFVRESLDKLSAFADMIVVSATPGEALKREWVEHDIAKYVSVIAGQEMGKKAEHLALAARDKYPGDRILMIGDAPGDLKAARVNGALFFPVKPGYEDESWEFFYNEAIDVFKAGEYAGAYEAKLIEEFEALLPDLPPWKQ